MSARIGVMTKEGFRSVFLYNTRDMVKLTKFLL
jgi:hypothetical protein